MSLLSGTVFKIQFTFHGGLLHKMGGVGGRHKRVTAVGCSCYLDNWGWLDMVTTYYLWMAGWLDITSLPCFFFFFFLMT